MNYFSLLEETMNKKKNLLRHLHTLLVIAIVFGALLACADIVVFVINVNAGFIVLATLVIYFARFRKDLYRRISFLMQCWMNRDRSSG